MKVNRKKKGFTLIELIVVIAILGILAAILIPRFAGFTDRANQKACLSDARTILTAYSTIVADTPSITSLPGTSDSKFTELAGTVKGTVSSATVSGGSIGFTYTLNHYHITCTNGALVGDPTK